MHAFGLAFVLAAISSVLTHPIHQEQRQEIHVVGREQSTMVPVAPETSAELELLSKGNKAFRDNIAVTDPGLLKKLADEGQSPPFMFLGCSDSRVSEGTVFNAKPGTLFAERNIANQFQSSDTNAHSVLSYAVTVLGVKHVIVMGHYGCGGVAASIASPPKGQIDAANGAVQNWIEPIREIFRASNRSEIVELRNKNAGRTDIKEPKINEPGFRALVEENVKASVRRIATNPVITNHYGLLKSGAGNSTSGTRKSARDVFIHGWVYDLATGKVHDLGISVGPPGKPVPTLPLAAVSKSTTQSLGSAVEASVWPNAACLASLVKRSAKGIILLRGYSLPLGTWWS
ncbi:hypothetical protein M413DRAFT_440519 [Hebeloma cylindrosporum]|uniref:Carbonic anhydrase n=1 Tax=Hebeloma cylindrosporum TaxID=76867 RepID=A0A0C3CDV0_HEBCY|nr:hypothetical protein M413DRAFT_440519 [Hebeloma cylindrosporum h7]